MALSFKKLTRPNIRKTQSGETIIEHGITFERLNNGDGRYKVNIMVDGVRVHRVIGRESEGVTRTQAESFIEQARTDARNGRLNLPKGRKTHLHINEAVSNYLDKLKQTDGKDIDKKAARFRLHILPFFKGKPLSKLETHDVEKYKKYRLDQGASKGSVNRELAALSHLLNMALEWKWIDHLPAKIKRYKEDKGRITYLTIAQIKRLVEAAKNHSSPVIYPFIIIGIETSMRRMEILSIRLQDIDLQKRVIYIPKAKTGARQQPITQSLADFLKGYIESAAENQIWLFPSIRSKTGHTENIEKAFRAVVTDAGMDPSEVVRHTLRHTAITHLVQAGVDLPTVQRISGHKTIDMVVRYSHQNGDHLSSAMDKLQSRLLIEH